MSSDMFSYFELEQDLPQVESEAERINRLRRLRSDGDWYSYGYADGYVEGFVDAWQEVDEG